MSALTDGGMFRVLEKAVAGDGLWYFPTMSGWLDTSIS